MYAHSRERQSQLPKQREKNHVNWSCGIVLLSWSGTRREAGKVSLVQFKAEDNRSRQTFSIYLLMIVTAKPWWLDAPCRHDNFCLILSMLIVPLRLLLPSSHRRLELRFLANDTCLQAMLNSFLGNIIDSLFHRLENDFLLIENADSANVSRVSGRTLNWQQIKSLSRKFHARFHARTKGKLSRRLPPFPLILSFAAHSNGRI